MLTATDRVTARLEEARLQIAHALILHVEKAGLYSVELAPLGDALVTEVRGEGLADWTARDGRLVVNFPSRVLGARPLEVWLERPHKDLPETITLSALAVAGATKQTAQIGAASAGGIRLKTSELTGLRELPVARLDRRTDELLAFVADQPEWTVTLAAEKLPPRTIAEIFNLVTIKGVKP